MHVSFGLLVGSYGVEMISEWKPFMSCWRLRTPRWANLRMAPQTLGFGLDGREEEGVGIAEIGELQTPKLPNPKQSPISPAQTTSKLNRKQEGEHFFFETNQVWSKNQLWPNETHPILSQKPQRSPSLKPQTFTKQITCGIWMVDPSKTKVLETNRKTQPSYPKTHQTNFF